MTSIHIYELTEEHLAGVVFVDTPEDFYRGREDALAHIIDGFDCFDDVDDFDAALESLTSGMSDDDAWPDLMIVMKPCALGDLVKLNIVDVADSIIDAHFHMLEDSTGQIYDSTTLDVRSAVNAAQVHLNSIKGYSKETRTKCHFTVADIRREIRESYLE